MASSRHSFEADEADHCETPRRAYQDIVPVLDQIAASCGKTRRDLIIYDPYYCDGGIKEKMKSLGCHNVINENRDFYHDISENTIPKHDVVVTNPPYSGDHMGKMLQFVSNNRGKGTAKGNNQSSCIPFLLLLPHYVYTKPYFQEYFQSDARGTISDNSNKVGNEQQLKELFYLVPKNNHRYSYEPPSWVSHESGSTALGRGKTVTAPFPSFWYCNVPSLMMTSQQPASKSKMKSKSKSKPGWLTKTFGKSGEYHVSSQNQNHQQHSNTNPALSLRLHYASCTSHLPREFKGEFDVTNKRPNPRARKRANKLKHQQPPPPPINDDHKKGARPAPSATDGAGKPKKKKKRY